MKEVMDTLPYIAFINVLLVVLALITKGQVRAFFKILAISLLVAMCIVVTGYLSPKSGGSMLSF